MTQDLIDPTVFEELQEAMGPEFATELLDTFLNDAANMFDSLEQAALAQDPDGYRRAAHSIKSNAQTFGATALADQARTIELAGTINTTAIEPLRAMFEETATALKGLIDE
ncbi:Hpt domain-containing protein [Ruegeria sp. HKCCD7255]|uniref:Hpt domain-containing protein n=1 Tax=Ruegeria sp. HKCCD7255 TaxID=2683004 RepID=UPI0014889651|nr:Hpt domain-containing protein [Ruegeria sp. HKCCD7255]